MSIDYESILDKGWGEIPETQTLPDGTYRLKGTGAKFKQSENEKSNDYVLFMYKPLEALEDVDSDALEGVGADGPDVSDVAKPVSHRVWIENASDFHKVRQHLLKHGVDAKEYQEEGNDFFENLALAFKAFRGKEINAYLTSRSFTTQAGEEVTENQPTSFTAIE